jgi:hypothetical protein
VRWCTINIPDVPSKPGAVNIPHDIMTINCRRIPCHFDIEDEAAYSPRMLISTNKTARYYTQITSSSIYEYTTMKNVSVAIFRFLVGTKSVYDNRHTLNWSCS